MVSQIDFTATGGMVVCSCAMVDDTKQRLSRQESTVFLVRFIDSVLFSVVAEYAVFIG